MNLNFVHLHLLLNHVPTVGLIVAFGLLLLALAQRSADLKRASLAVYFAIALMSLPTYMTGHAAQRVIEKHPGISTEMIHRHQRAALLALTFVEATGVIAWFGLWRNRRPGGTAWHVPAVVVLSVVSIGLMSGAANIGGEISHPEILADGQATTGTLAPMWLDSAQIARYQFRNPWAWPILETIHFIGLCLLFGVVLLGNLRIVGLMRTAALGDVYRLLPWGVLGFVLNSITGMAFFIGQAFQYVDNPAFHWKVVFMLLAGANVLYLTLFDDIWTLGSNEEAPSFAKFVAASQIFLWIGVIYFGRMLPYIGGAF